MSKPFDELRKKMSPESQKRAAAKTLEMLKTIPDACPWCGVIPDIAKPAVFGIRVIHPENGCFMAKRRPGDLGEAWLLEDWNHRAAPSPATPGAEGATERQKFEDWYTLTAFDLVANPIGGRECLLKWQGWMAATNASPPAAQEQKPVAELKKRDGIVSFHTLVPIEQFYDGMPLFASPIPASGWVKCSDEDFESDPEPEKMVLVSIGNSVRLGYKQVRRHPWNKRWKIFGYGTDRSDSVDHWVPLPAAPKVTK